jgi:hypothetical protein
MRPPLPSTWRIQFASGMRSRAIGKCEDAENRGQLPDYVQRRNGGALEEYYCMDTVGATGLDTLGKAWPLLVSGSCEQQRQYAQKRGALRTREQFEAARAADPMSVLGWIFLSIGPDEHGNPHAHHTGVCGDVDDATGALVVSGPRGGWLTVEGNASDPKKPASRNGDGIYHGRERGHAGDHGEYEFIDPGAY